MSEQETNIFGRPIIGEVPRYSEGMAKQKDPQIFADALDALLDVEGVKAVVWQQYTPYFNDGDPCTFSAYGVGVRLTKPFDENADPLELDEFDEGDEEELGTYDLDDGPVKQALRAFERELESGAHDSMLCTTFGDPSRVTATKEGFSIEEYSHD